MSNLIKKYICRWDRGIGILFFSYTRRRQHCYREILFKSKQWSHNLVKKTCVKKRIIPTDRLTDRYMDRFNICIMYWYKCANIVYSRMLYLTFSSLLVITYTYTHSQTQQMNCNWWKWTGKIFVNKRIFRLQNNFTILMYGSKCFSMFCC